MCPVSLATLTEFPDICSNFGADSEFGMAAVSNTSVGTEGVLRFPSKYSVDEYTHRHSGCPNACQFALSPAGFTLTTFISGIELETAYAGWRCRWKHRGGRHAEDVHTHGRSVYMPFCQLRGESFLRKTPRSFDSQASSRWPYLDGCRLGLVV